MPGSPGALPAWQEARALDGGADASPATPHVVEIYFSRWTGLEIYRIDGVERLRDRNFAFSSVRRFEIEDNGPHVLEIATKAFPWPSGEVFLDGRPIIADLFPGERRLAMTACAVLLLLLAALVVVLGVGWKMGRLPPRLGSLDWSTIRRARLETCPTSAYGIRNTRPVIAAASYTAPRMLSGSG
jgi:hypothetical protein